MFESIVANVIVRATRLLTGAQSRWIGCSPEQKQRIYFANHTSHLDFLLLWAALPPRMRQSTRPVAAADYWGSSPLRRYLLEGVFRGVLVERGTSFHKRDPLEPMHEAIKHGDSLILFPEGTRGDGEVLQPFKSGIFHLARTHPQVELVPVWMHNAYRVMPKGEFLPLPLLCSATFGEPARLEPHEDKETFLSRLHSILAAVGQS